MIFVTVSRAWDFVNLPGTPVLMGMLLAVHLGIVAGLFLTLPYGECVHVAHRSAALVRRSMERSRLWTGINERYSWRLVTGRSRFPPSPSHSRLESLRQSF